MLCGKICLRETHPVDSFFIMLWWGQESTIASLVHVQYLLGMCLAYLYDTAITVLHCVVGVVDDDSLEVLDDTALQVATTTCFHGCVHQTLQTRNIIICGEMRLTVVCPVFV